jgi:hypothetical protein
MTQRLEADIRQALDAKAYEVEVPAELATRTLDAAGQVAVRQPLWDRLKAWRDGRRMRFPATGYPRWLMGTGALATAAALFLVGTLVTMPPRDLKSDALVQEISDEPASLLVEPNSGTAGAVSSGDASTDQSADVDVAAPGFTSLAAGGEALEPQLVRGATIRVAVANFEDSWAKANEVASDHGGHVIGSQTREVQDEIAEGTVQMRVPSSELEAVLEDLRGLGTVARLETSGDDIAKQIDDVKQRAADRKREEAELKDLEARARTFTETLEVRRRLEGVRQDIDNLEKKQKGYEDQVELSVVSATIFEDEVAAGRGSSMLGTAARTSGRLALTVLAGALVAAGALAPAALLALAVWLAVRTLRRRRSSGDDSST